MVELFANSGDADKMSRSATPNLGLCPQPPSPPPPHTHTHTHPVAWWIGELTLNPLGFSPLWFDPSSGHIWGSQVLLTDGQVFFPGFSGFRPPLMNDRLDIISEIF